MIARYPVKTEEDFFIGRSERNYTEVGNEVLVKKTDNNYVRIGDYAQVKITNAELYDLYDQLV